MKQNKINKIFSFENVLGLLLVILIIFELNVEHDIKLILNSPLGMVLSLIILVLLFIFINPIVGLLFLIYLYEIVSNKSLLNVNSLFNEENKKINILNKLNLGNNNNDKVELNVINKMAPIVKKMENFNSRFLPNTPNMPYEKI